MNVTRAIGLLIAGLLTLYLAAYAVSKGWHDGKIK